MEREIEKIGHLKNYHCANNCGNPGYDIYIPRSGAETGLVLLVPGTTNNSVNVIQNGLKIIH